MEGRRLRIAVIGGGAAGITAACLLQERHEVTLYEAASVLGGHAHSHRIDNGREPPFEVDTAFVIFNGRSYPLFLKLLARFGCADLAQPAEMSFSYDSPEAGVGYAVNRGLGGMLARPGAWRDPFFYRLLPELARFRRQGARDLASGLGGVTLREYLARLRFSPEFLERFLGPTAAAVWSLPPERIREMPAGVFLRFLDNHRYLGGRRGQWLRLAGGAGQYVRAFEGAFRGRLRLGTPVARVVRPAGGGAWVHAAAGPELYDRVVVATHADQALRLLADPSPEEHGLLGAWTYHRAPTVLHTDPAKMPALKRTWASWNIRYGSSPAWVTYHLNRVQALASRTDYFVTLGECEYPESQVLARFEYEHPVLDFGAIETQPRLARLNGLRDTYFCGSYFGFGFHEDAVRSAAEVARAMGAPGLE